MYLVFFQREEFHDTNTSPKGVRNEYSDDFLEARILFIGIHTCIRVVEDPKIK